MKLSVVIPGYNTPDNWWTRCLNSVLAALPDEGEIICVDDGSKTRPKPAVDDPRIKWIFLEKNVGQSAARNVALKSAVGEYVTFVDSDDEVVHDVYHRCLGRLSEDGSDIAVYGCKPVWVAEGLYKEDVPAAGNLGALSEPMMKRLFDDCLLEYVWNKVFRRDFLIQNGIKFREDICPGEDTIFVLECIKAKAKWSAVDVVGYVYYRYSGSSLSRYLPTYAEAMKMKTVLWREVYSGVMPDCTEAYQANMLWDNLWRKGSPLSFREKCAYGRAHSQSVIKILLKLVAKRYCYAVFVRRWKIKRTFPRVVGIEKNKEQA